MSRRCGSKDKEEREVDQVTWVRARTTDEGEMTMAASDSLGFVWTRELKNIF